MPHQGEHKPLDQCKNGQTIKKSVVNLTFSISEKEKQFFYPKSRLLFLENISHSEVFVYNNFW